MKAWRPLVLALSFSLVVCLIVWFVLSQYGVSTPDAARTALGLLALVSPFYTAIDKSWTGKKENLELPSYSDFCLPQSLLAVIGWIAGTALIVFPPALFLSAIDVSGGAPEMEVPAVQHAAERLGVLLSVACIYALGRWVGRRTLTPNYSIMVAMVCLCRFTSVCLDFLGGHLNSSQVPYKLIGGTILYLVPFLIGYRSGLKNRWRLYLTYAADRLSANDRKALIDLVAAEAAKALSNRRGS
jgi:hypothetical protein